MIRPLRPPRGTLWSWAGPSPGGRVATASDPPLSDAVHPPSATGSPAAVGSCSPTGHLLLALVGLPRPLQRDTIPIGWSTAAL
jgi:hypothetical protein